MSSLPPPPPPAIRAAPCAARALALRLDGEDGALDGMSHAGTRLILRNVGAVPCSVVGLPRLTFQDARGRPLPIARTAPPGMHPGPVVLPVTLAPRAEAGTGLRWVSGNVFDRNRCFTPARLTAAIGRVTLRTRFTGRLCAPADAPAGFEQAPLTPGREWGRYGRGRTLMRV